MTESKRSKTERLFIGIIIAVFVIVAIMPTIAYLSHQAESSTGGVILPDNTALYVHNATMNNTAFSTSGANVVYTSATNVTFITWNATFKQLNEASAYMVELNETTGQNASIGFFQNNTFMPFTSGSFVNGTLNLTLNAQDTLTPNQTQDLIIKLNQSTPANLTVSIYGQTSVLTSTIGTIPTLDMGYLTSGLLTLGLAFMISPHHDTRAMNPMEHTKKRKRSRKYNRRRR